MLALRGSLGSRRWLTFSSRDQAERAALAAGRAFLEMGQPPRAIRAVTKVRNGGPHEGEALAIKGQALAALEETGPARQALERSWKLTPTSDAARVLAAIYLSSNENERGLQMLIEAARLDPSDFRPWYAMGESVYLRLGRCERAVDAFRESLQRRADHVPSRTGLLEALLKSHRPEEAAPLIETVLSEGSDDPRALTLAGEFALESGDGQRAAQHLRQALAIDPDHRPAVILNARLFFGEGRRREALPLAEHACALDPNDASTLTLLYTIQTSLGLRKEAEKTHARKREVQQRVERMEQLAQEITNHPSDPEPRWRMGQLASEANMMSLAIQSFQGALAQAPTYEPARKSLLDLGFPPSRLPPSSRPGLTNALP
jgi:tetratricopeptide (TPR) repeat protein